MFYSLLYVAVVEDGQHCDTIAVSFSYTEQALMPLVLEVITACKAYVCISGSSVFKSLTIGDETNSKSLLLNAVSSWDQIIVLKHIAWSSCTAEIF